MVKMQTIVDYFYPPRSDADLMTLLNSGILRSKSRGYAEWKQDRAMGQALILYQNALQQNPIVKYNPVAPAVGKAMINAEKEILKQSRVCKNKNLLPEYPNPSGYQQLSNNESFQPFVQDAFQCFSESMFGWDASQFPTYEVAKVYEKWLVSSGRLGGNSVEGSVYKFKFKNNPLFAIKISNDPDSNVLSGMPHEAIIGLYALNPLKAIIPNFMHIYSSFTCSPPVMEGVPVLTEKGGDRRPIFSLCPADKAYASTHMVVENIPNAVTMNSWIQSRPDMSPAEFLQVFLQVISAINVAALYCDFTHYDLHTENVLVQSISDPAKDYVVPFYEGVPSYVGDKYGKVRYIRTKHVARIIDYGRCYAYIGAKFGSVAYRGQEQSFTFTGNSYPARDSYTFLAWCYTGWEEATIRNRPAVGADGTIRESSYNRAMMGRMFADMHKYFSTVPGGNTANVKEWRYLIPSQRSIALRHDAFLGYIFQYPDWRTAFESSEAALKDVRRTDVDIGGCGVTKCLTPDEIKKSSGGIALSIAQLVIYAKERQQKLRMLPPIGTADQRVALGATRLLAVSKERDQILRDIESTSMNKGQNASLLTAAKSKLKNTVKDIDDVMKNLIRFYQDHTLSTSPIKAREFLEEILRARVLLLKAYFLRDDITDWFEIQKFFDLEAMTRQLDVFINGAPGASSDVKKLKILSDSYFNLFARYLAQSVENTPRWGLPTSYINFPGLGPRSYDNIIDLISGAGFQGGITLQQLQALAGAGLDKNSLRTNDVTEYKKILLNLFEKIVVLKAEVLEKPDPVNTYNQNKAAGRI